MELRTIRYFVTTAHMLSMTRAAEYYQIPQSAISATIKKLETEIGCKLFNRVNNSITLTKQGEDFLLHCEAAMLSLETGIQEVQKSSTDLVDSIYLQVSQNHVTLMDAVAEFKQLYPDVSFFISPAPDYYTMPNDLYLCSEAPANQSIDTGICLVQEPIVLAILRTHPLGKRDCVSIQELRDVPLIFGHKNSVTRKLFVNACMTYGFAPQNSIYFDDIYCMMHFATSGLGAAVVPYISWSGVFREHPQLHAVNLEEPLYRETYLYWNKKRGCRPAVKRFIEFLEQYYSKLCGDIAAKM